MSYMVYLCTYIWLILFMGNVDKYTSPVLDGMGMDQWTNGTIDSGT